MSDVSGIPNLGIPAMGGGAFFANPGAGLANAQAQYAQNQGYFGDQARAMHAGQVPQAQLYGGGSFGAQPAAYAALGAAYGRGTGGFGRGAAPSASVFDTGAAPFQGYGLPNGGGLGAFSPSPNYPGGRAAIAQSLMPPPPDFDSTFSNFGNQRQMRNQPAIDQMLRFNGVGTGVAPDAAPGLPPSLPPTASEGGEGSFANRFGAAPDVDENSFANRFGAGQYFRPGTPSQYYTGTRYPGAQAPPAGYQSLFSADNPGGALPMGGFRGLPSPPVMNEAQPDDLGPADTLTSRDRAIGRVGGSGGFYPTAFNSSQFAPSSPFGSGAGVGGGRSGAGGLSSGTGTQMPPTATPFFGGGGSGFGAPGSTAGGGQYGGIRRPGQLGAMPGFIGASQDTYGNPFIQGNAPPYELQGSRLGGGYGIGGLGQGTAFRGVR